MAGFDLPRTARLLSRSDFAALREGSQRLVTRSFVAEYRLSEKGLARMGVAISRRVSKRAVERNRIRRTIRESFRANRAELPHVDILVIARTLAAQQTNPLLRDDLLIIWSKLKAAVPASPLKE
jgi:ribonuclease P protein component